MQGVLENLLKTSEIHLSRTSRASPLKHSSSLSGTNFDYPEIILPHILAETENEYESKKYSKDRTDGKD